MIIRCPQCAHTRSVSEDSIPKRAEFATCPRCKLRFRFRTLPREEQNTHPLGTNTFDFPDKLNDPPLKKEQDKDIWDAVDALQQKWQEPEQQKKDQEQIIAQTSSSTSPITAHSEQLGDLHNVTPKEIASLKAQEEETEAAQETINLDKDKHAAISVLDISLGEETSPDKKATSHKMKNPAAATTESTESATELAIIRSLEEKVEQDLQMITAPVERPVKELGILDDLLQREEETDPQDSGVIPWEHIREFGWARGFIATMHLVMFQPITFFGRLTPHAPLTPSYLFLLIQGYIVLICSAVWIHLSNFIMEGSRPFLTPTASFPTILLLAPLLLGAAQIVIASLTHLLLILAAPTRTQFTLLFKLTGYAVAPLILSIIPFVGPITGLVWFLTAYMLGCRAAMQLKGFQALLAVCPLLLCIGLFFIFFFM